MPMFPEGGPNDPGGGGGGNELSDPVEPELPPADGEGPSGSMLRIRRGQTHNTALAPYSKPTNLTYPCAISLRTSRCSNPCRRASVSAR